MGLGLFLSPRQELAPQLKLEAQELLKQYQVLKDRVPPETVKGVEGMKRANDLLAKKGVSGVLVGGLTRSVWSERVPLSQLSGHKDVDVIIDEGAEVNFKKFEGGVDWWSTESRDVLVTGIDGSKYTLKVKFHRNGNGVVLYYNVDVAQSLEPGLYIPPYESIRQIEYSTLETMADLRASKGVTIEDGVLDFAYEKLDLPRVRGKLLADVAKSVKGILNWNYVNVNNIEAPRLIGVHKYFKKSPFRT